MTSGDDSYPSAWTPRGAQPPAPPAPAEAVEAIMLAIDSFIAALSQDELDQLLQRTRGA